MIRIGQGIDFHQFSKQGQILKLGGVEIPFLKKVIAHSDGDVLLHALMDALLGASGSFEDIGSLFPDNNPAFKNISSVKLLEKVLEIIKPWFIVNIDITLLAQKPKIAPYKNSIRESLAKMLSISPSQIGLKATTTEKMGAIGREEGIACWVVVLLQKTSHAFQEPTKKVVPEQKKPSQAVEVWTDGSCLGNPGPGGWGVVVHLGDQTEELKGGVLDTTNNRMELMAVIKGLEYLLSKGLSKASLYTDSNYVKNGIQSWIYTWKKNGWVNAKKEPVKNQDLWQALDNLNQQVDISYHWVKGHSGNVFNERCDVLAKEGAQLASKENESLF